MDGGILRGNSDLDMSAVDQNGDPLPGTADTSFYGTYISPTIPDFLENMVGIETGAEVISEASRDERAGIMGEVFDSTFKRIFPDGSEAYDVLSQLFTSPRESWRLENEFETVTAVLGLMPRFVQSFVLNNTIEPLLRLVGLDQLADLAIRNPDDFINRLRTMEADFGSLYTGLRTVGILR